MNIAGSNAERHVERPAPGDERGWLRLVLDLQPFPALVVDTSSGATVLANAAARRVPLVPPAGADGAAFHACDASGASLPPERLGHEMSARASGPEGAAISWQTPAQRFGFRVYSRDLPPADGRSAWAVLTFLDQTQQAEAEAELRRALELRDEFFSIATHELKDPLFSLQLACQLLRHSAMRLGDVPAYVRQHLEVSQRQIERLSRLIDNLLDVSRIMNRRLQLDLEALDLGDLAREFVGRFRDRTDAAGTALSAEAPGPVLGDFDRMKLEQVLANLLTNAIKYGAGKPVDVRAHADGDEAVLEVEDRGAGIAPEDQSRIFARFERASQGHKKESLGLGLYIVRSLVEAHGGTVGVRSEPGRGATFTVRLPRTPLGKADGADHAGRGRDTSRE